MTIKLRTRVELTCWDLIIPAMTRLRKIQSIAQPRFTGPLTLEKFAAQVLATIASGLLIGLGGSILYSFLH